jgi:hypothetical protein
MNVNARHGSGPPGPSWVDSLYFKAEFFGNVGAGVYQF